MKLQLIFFVYKFLKIHYFDIDVLTLISDTAITHCFRPIFFFLSTMNQYKHLPIGSLKIHETKHYSIITLMEDLWFPQIIPRSITLHATVYIVRCIRIGGNIGGLFVVTSTRSSVNPRSRKIKFFRTKQHTLHSEE